MARIGQALDFRAQFYSVSGDVLTGATVTVNIRKPDGTLLVSGGAAAEISTTGVYQYTLSAGSNDVTGRWQAQFLTSNVNADVLRVTDWLDVDVAELPIDDTAILAAVGSPLQAVNYVAPANADISAIKAKTDNLPTDPASNTQVNTRLAAVDYTAPDNATIATIDGKADDIIEDIYSLTHNEEGDPISRVIPLPTSSDTCVIYEYCFASDGATPLSSVNSSARITSLPYDYSDKLHSGAMLAGSYDANTGLLQWEVVRGAGVIVSIQEVGIFGNIIIPNAAQARIYDLI